MQPKLQVSSPERTRKGSKQRLHFTPWLKEQIESGDIYGVEWIDKDLGIFKSIWVRVDNPEFNGSNK